VAAETTRSLRAPRRGLAADDRFQAPRDADEPPMPARETGKLAPPAATDSRFEEEEEPRPGDDPAVWEPFLALAAERA
ncbi:MAG: hypothetical protein ABIR39_21065, partial [Nocardioides sp.]|uniref:hypothetical protein n=1 Tax=Nocardioides sp. TaxID=35761 RepID=UPI0032659075